MTILAMDFKKYGRRDFVATSNRVNILNEISA